MFSSEIQVRVRYAETDRMGYVYYGNYATYFEVARVEALRELGTTYKEMEDKGIMLPVLDYCVKFIKPALYDDMLTIKTTINELPGARIKFTYETFNEKGVLLNTASTSLVFINTSTQKPCAAPADLLERMKNHFANQV